MTATEPRRFASSGGELSYIDVGEGPAVLLLHGFPLSSVTWRALTPALAPRFRVLVPDLLGYGGSDRPADAPLDLRAQTRYVRELLDHLGVDRVALIGHAHGGGVAQLLALDGGVDVAAMVLLDSVAFDAWPVGSTRELQQVDPGRLDAAIVEAGMRAAFLTGVGDPADLDDALVATYVAPWIGDGGPAAFVRAAQALDGEGLTGHEAAFAAWTFPIMLLWGEDDPFLPPSVAERLHDALPSSTLGLLPSIGHFIVDEAGATVVPMVAGWLRSRYLGEPHTHGDAHAPVMLELGRRSALEDLAAYEDDDEPVRFDPHEQEVGPNA